MHFSPNPGTMLVERPLVGLEQRLTSLVRNPDAVRLRRGVCGKFADYGACAEFHCCFGGKDYSGEF